MSTWRLAKSLIKLREQINAAAPNRSKLSDGSIGDTAHASRVSDHNPVNGVVHAIDITHDPLHGVDGTMLSRALTYDARVKYVIWHGEIWKARTRQWETYHGANPHNHHVHVSVTPQGADSEYSWKFIAAFIKPVFPVIRRGDHGDDVRLLQQQLSIENDGIFGFGTERAVKRFQEAHGLGVDGIVGPATWTALMR